MDDGRLTVFRWLDRGFTGLPTASASWEYHGPGRGAGHAIATLLVGHQLTRDAAFLAKAEQLIRRTIHPSDEIAGRKLDDPEHRWSYTIYLQTLGKYLDYKIERGELDRMYEYAQASLLHYARWMLRHEYPYLEKPERLEYPTETWAAQDIRKADIFWYAALHSTVEERQLWSERAGFFFRYATSTLQGFRTAACTRPVVILLSNGYMHLYASRYAGNLAALPRPDATRDFGAPMAFMPQKTRAVRKFAALAILAGAILVTALVYLLVSR
jgi:hypothetical protein